MSNSEDRQAILHLIPTLAAGGGEMQLLQNMDFSLEMENLIMGQILTDGADPADATEAWLQENPEVLDTWLEGVTTLDGGDAMAAVKEELGL